MNKCLDRVNDRHFRNPGVSSYAIIPRCSPNLRVFFFIVTSIVYVCDGVKEMDNPRLTRRCPEHIRRDYAEREERVDELAGQGADRQRFVVPIVTSRRSHVEI
jgi:hypothetical protein